MMMEENFLKTNSISKEPLLLEIADYICDQTIESSLAIKTAQIALLDSLACAMLALKAPNCRALLGPYLPGIEVPFGSRVPGTNFILDPLKAAFDIGCMIRWLDYNDTWLAAEWGHPSDNLGGLLSVADHCSLRDLHQKKKTNITLSLLWQCMIKAYEIQGVIALNHAFNRLGLDHVFLVKIATTATVAYLYNFSKDQIIAALSHAFIDGASLRTYRHAPNTGSRKSWAAGDATKRGVELVWFVSRGEASLPLSLSAKNWGFFDAILKGKKMELERKLGSYVMENILFKVAYPAEFHAQTALEAAIILHPMIKNKWNLIEKIMIETQEAGFRIINKEGPLHNYADRDHSIQYIVAIGLLYGDLKPEDYHDKRAADPNIDNLRSKMTVIENEQFTKDYFDAKKRAIPNAIQIFFQDGSKTDKIRIDYPLGHQRRREEAGSLLREKYQNALFNHYPEKQAEKLYDLWGNLEKFGSLPVSQFIDMWV